MTEGFTGRDPDCALKIAADPGIPVRIFDDPLICSVKDCDVKVKSSGVIVGMSKWFRVEGNYHLGTPSESIYQRS